MHDNSNPGAQPRGEEVRGYLNPPPQTFRFSANLSPNLANMYHVQQKSPSKAHFGKLGAFCRQIRGLHPLIISLALPLLKPSRIYLPGDSGLPIILSQDSVRILEKYDTWLILSPIPICEMSLKVTVFKRKFIILLLRPCSLCKILSQSNHEGVSKATKVPIIVSPANFMFGISVMSLQYTHFL